MLPSGVAELIEKLHNSTSGRVALCLPGGGATSGAWLTTVPRASNTVVEAVVPYARESIIDYLGKEPRSYCSEETALSLAEVAYKRAVRNGPYGVPLFGVAATCALATSSPKKGDHRVFVGLHGRHGAKVYKLTLCKGARSRSGEEEIASRVVVGTIGNALLETDDALPEMLDGHLVQGEEIECSSRPQSRDVGEAIDGLLHGTVDCVEFCGDEVVVDAPRARRAYLSGSFNPLHDGHIGMLKLAEKVLGTTGCFEMTVSHPDKGIVDREEVLRRVGQFKESGMPIVLTAKHIFTRKAMLFEGSTFVVGYDTAARLVNPKYYKNDKETMLVEFEGLRSRGCSFFVLGRLDDGQFKGLEDINLPEELTDLFAGVSEAEFRIDVSSTEIRNRKLQESGKKQSDENGNLA
ncbi:hypothetical protein BSKO_09092 [Bryopsis sp. KO-2023]|nr:hypothetical protein BSKO_09092 [Bryopsis sp. KO-2023]